MTELVKTERNLRKERIGTVVSASMQKTVVVAVKFDAEHPLYGKTISKTSKFKAHFDADTIANDAKGEKQVCGVGDTVRIIETRPISKDKRWRVVEIIEKSKAVDLITGSSAKQSK